MIVEQNILLSNLTSVKLGGTARFYSRCRSNSEILEAVKWAKSNHCLFFVLGGGSNTLFRDSPFDGLILHIDTKGRTWDENGLVKVAAGEVWTDLVTDSVQRGYSGIECLAGIPGTVGATPIQNVGAYGQEVKDVIVKVITLNVNNLQIKEFDNSECLFQYRNSRFKDPQQDKGQYIIQEVWFQLSRPNEFTYENSLTYPELKRAVLEDDQWKSKQISTFQSPMFVSQKVLELRHRKGMVLKEGDQDTVSLGSFFMNPVVSTQELEALKDTLKSTPLIDSFQAFAAGSGQWKLSAAWLIEKAGITKGFQLKNAGVSTKHCLALTNRGNATTEQMLDLAKHIQSTVKNKFNIDLKIEPEVV